MIKRKTASAIGYKKGEPAPKLLASGYGRNAEKIIEIAEKEGIVIMEDAALAALLDVSVKPGDFIPLHLWETVAKILAFVKREPPNGGIIIN